MKSYQIQKKRKIMILSQVKNNQINPKKKMIFLIWIILILHLKELKIYFEIFVVKRFNFYKKN